MARQDSGGKVEGRPSHRHCGVVNVVAGPTLNLLVPVHFVRDRRFSLDSFSIQLNPDRIWVQVSKIDLNLEVMLHSMLSLLSPRRNEACSTFVPKFVPNWRSAGASRHGWRSGNNRPRPPGDSVVRCIRERCGWRRSVAPTAPCFPASAQPRPLESQASRARPVSC